MRPRTQLLVALGVVASLLPFAYAAEHADPTSVDASERLTVRLVGIESSYGSEGWKLYPGYYAATPQAGLQSAATRFDGALGLRLRLRVELVNDQMQPPGDPDLQNVNLTAQILTPQGPLRGFVSREPTGVGGLPTPSNSRFFHLNFDLDGSSFNNPDPADPLLGTPVTGLSSGVHEVDVDIFYRGLPGNQVDRGSAKLRFALTMPRQAITVSGFGAASYTHDVPDDMFRLFTDIGFGNTVRFVNRPLDPGQNVTARYEFGVANATVRWWALAAERVNAPNAPSGSVAIHRKQVGSDQRTDLNGTVTFTTPAGQLLQYGARTFSSSLVVLAAQLVPEADVGGAVVDTYPQGSAAIRAGAAEFVVAITRNLVNVTGFSIDTSRYENAPDPAKAGAAQSNVLLVTAYDDSGAAFGGDAVAVDAQRGGGTYARANIQPHPDPILAGRYRQARLSTQPILDQNDAHYRIYTLLYTNPDQFHGFAFADRGYRASLWIPPQKVGVSGNAYLNLTSLTTNYDTVAQRDLTLRILGKFVSTQLNIDRNQVIELPEGDTLQIQIPLRADRDGEAALRFTGYTGDVLHSQAGTIVFGKPPETKRFADQIPGVPALALLAALGVAALIFRRRGEAY